MSMESRYIILAMDADLVASCEANPLVAPLVESIGSASLAARGPWERSDGFDIKGDTIREAAHKALDHTLDQMGISSP